MRATLLLLVGFWLAGCGPDEELSLRTLGRPLVGVPQDGYPNYNERLMLVAINRCRADPNVEGETKASCSADRSIHPPLMRNQNGSRAARFHCANCIINDGGLSHSSYCTLRSDIGTTFEHTCDGSADCACEAGSEHFSCTTSGGHGTGFGTRCGYFGYGASGEVGAAGYTDGWSAVWGWISECDGEDGHRRILTGGYDEIGLGYYTGSTRCWSRLYFGDLGNNAPFTYTLPAGVHRSRSGTYDFLVNYYDPGGAPESVNLVLDGTCHPMTLEIGNADNATYLVNLDVGSGCHQYWFLVRDSSGGRVTYPEEGAWGVGSCTDYVPTATEAGCEVCNPGESQPCGLGQCAGTQTCNSSGTWDPCDGADPDPTESCDGVDNDCDGSIPADEADDDNDGVMVCAGDCDDSDGDRYPGAQEICDGKDNDCDGSPGTGEVDADSDTYMVCENDCDDSSADVNPGATETCNGIDDDCDGLTDNGLPDADNDGYNICVDCDDGNPDVHPGAAEACNGQDDDCDGATDEGCECQDGSTRPCSSDVGECRAGTQTCENGHWGECDGVLPTAEECNGLDDDCDGVTDNGFPDADNDGHNSCADCDDTNPDVHPGAVEACNGEDDDCDGSPGPGEVDADSDTYMVCENDCDDSDPGIHPGAAEACNDIDDDCDGATDEGCACTTGESRPCGSDVGACEPGTQTCEDGAWGDCLGGVSATQEVCNGVDDDCDGDIDEDCSDIEEVRKIMGSCGCVSGRIPGSLLPLFLGLFFLLRRRISVRRAGPAQGGEERQEHREVLVRTR